MQSFYHSDEKYAVVIEWKQIFYFLILTMSPKENFQIAINVIEKY